MENFQTRNHSINKKTLRRVINEIIQEKGVDTREGREEREGKEKSTLCIFGRCVVRGSHSLRDVAGQRLRYSGLFPVQFCVLNAYI